jgi:membrane protease YdiL (CAAX protease family)
MAVYESEPRDTSAFAMLRTYAPTRVRWTFLDLIAVALLTLVLGSLGLGTLRAALGSAGIAALQTQPLLTNMGLGAIVYSLALLVTLVWIVLRGRGSWREIGFRRTSPWWLLLVFGMFILQFVGVAIVNLIVQTVVGAFENPQIAALSDPRGFSWLNFLAVFTVGAIIAPIVEEVIFRGLLYQWLRSRAGVVVAVLASAAIFGAAHVIPLLFPSLFVVGLILALAFEFSQSLWVTIALHMLQNGLAIIVLFAIQASGIPLPQ